MVGARIGRHPNAPEQAGKAEAVRKVIYNATMKVTVKNVETAEQGLIEQINKFQGYIVDVLVVQQQYLREHRKEVEAVVRTYLELLTAVNPLGTELLNCDQIDSFYFGRALSIFMFTSQLSALTACKPPLECGEVHMNAFFTFAQHLIGLRFIFTGKSANWRLTT